GDDSNSIRRFPPIPGRIFAVAFSPDGKRIAAGSSLDHEGFVYVYSADYDSDTPPEIVKIESKRDNRRTNKEKAKLEKYYSSNVKILAKLEGQGGPVYGIDFSPDGKTIVSAGFDGHVRLNSSE